MRGRLGSHPGRVEFELDETMGAFGMAGNALVELSSLKNLEALHIERVRTEVTWNDQLILGFLSQMGF